MNHFSVSASRVINYMSKQNKSMINVFSSSNTEVIKVAKSILDDAGVSYQMKNERNDKKESSKFFEIHVNEDNFRTAKEVLRDLYELDFGT